MRRAWVKLTVCRIGQEGDIVNRLKEDFPEIKFKIGESNPPSLWVHNIMGCPDRVAVIYVLLPAPHPNETAREFFVKYWKLT